MWCSAAHPYFQMIVFHSDLDNTIIYSYKHDIGESKRCVENYQGREVSFLTDRTYELLKQVSQKTLIIPTTTRTVEQYRRIDLGIGPFQYVLTCNGGVLLVNGEEEEKWYEESLALIADCKEEMKKAMELMDKDPARNFELRYIKELFLFTKSLEPDKSVEMLRAQLDFRKVDVFRNGVKVYVVPKELNKGKALIRMKERLDSDVVIAAGDSEFDIPMLDCADFAIAPAKLQCKRREDDTLTKVDEQELFSESVLKRVLRIADS